MSVPQDVPAVTFVLVSVQDGAAPEQTSAPVWHLFAGVHAPPIWHVAHEQSTVVPLREDRSDGPLVRPAATEDDQEKQKDDTHHDR